MVEEGLELLDFRLLEEGALMWTKESLIDSTLVFLELLN